jgi:hypothetical protein
MGLPGIGLAMSATGMKKQIWPYERNMIDELALRLVHGELPIGS